MDPLQGVGSVGLVCEIKPGYEVFAVSKYHGPLKASCAGLVRYLATIRTWNLVHHRVKSVQGQVFNLAEQVVQGILRHATLLSPSSGQPTNREPSVKVVVAIPS